MKKTVEQWEKDKNLVIKDLKDLTLKKQITEEEFLKVATFGNVIGVDHEARTAWLKKNGHKVTRENLTDHELLVKDR